MAALYDLLSFLPETAKLGASAHQATSVAETPKQDAAPRIMGRLFIYITCLLLGFLAIVAYGSLDGDTTRRLMRDLDVFGVSQAAVQERTRVTTIMALPITYERKQALVDNKVFMGATPGMVALALGRPKSERLREGSESAPSLRVWYMYLAGESRPTVLEFEQDVLVKAYKGSAIDVQ